MDHDWIQRRRSLTDDDVAAIAHALKHESCSCPFTPDEVSGIRSVLELLKETKSSFIKGMVGAAVIVTLTLLHFGVKVWSKQ
jgi:hypothetical protein